MNRRWFLRRTFQAWLASQLPLLSPLLRLSGAAEPPPSRKLNRYVLISMFESPPRWMFDFPLQRTGSAQFVPHPAMGTEFDTPTVTPGGVKTPRLKMASVPRAGFDWPSLWSKPIPLSGGGWGELSRHLPEFALIRGCDMRQDGHPQNSMRLEAATPGEISLGGLIAEGSPTPFGAIGMSGTEAAGERSLISAFRMPSGRALQTFDETDVARNPYIDQLLRPFEGATEPKDEERFHELLGEHLAPRDGTLLKQISRETSPALARIRKLPLREIRADYEAAEKRYRDLVHRAFHDKPLAGVMDAPVPGLRLPCRFPRPAKAFENDDFLGAWKMDDHYVGSEDLRTVFRRVSNKTLSHQFAMVETALIHQLADVLLFNVDPPAELEFKDSYRVNRVRSRNVGDQIEFYTEDPPYSSPTRPGEGEVLNIDGHNVGSAIGLMGYSLYYRALAACIVELKSRLARAGGRQPGGSVFDETLIHLTSEFERRPRSDLGGTDHGWRGHTSTLISGRIRGTEVIGNIRTRSPEGRGERECTWGEGAPLQANGRVLAYSDIAATLAHLFQVAPPAPGLKLLNGEGRGIVRSAEESRSV